MQEIGMTKLTNEVKNFVAERLESGEWNFAVFYQDELVWSNDEKRVWCRLFKDYKFKTKHQWKKKAMAFEISLSPEQDCWVDEIQVSVVREEEIIYSRIVKIAPIHLAQGDTCTALLQFNIKAELS